QRAGPRVIGGGDEEGPEDHTPFQRLQLRAAKEGRDRLRSGESPEAMGRRKKASHKGRTMDSLLHDARAECEGGCESKARVPLFLVRPFPPNRRPRVACGFHHPDVASCRLPSGLFPHPVTAMPAENREVLLAESAPGTTSARSSVTA